MMLALSYAKKKLIGEDGDSEGELPLPRKRNLEFRSKELAWCHSAMTNRNHNPIKVNPHSHHRRTRPAQYCETPGAPDDGEGASCIAAPFLVQTNATCQAPGTERRMCRESRNVRPPKSAKRGSRLTYRQCSHQELGKMFVSVVHQLEVTVVTFVGVPKVAPPSLEFTA